MGLSRGSLSLSLSFYSCEPFIWYLYFYFFKKKTLATHIIRLRPTTCRCRGGVGGDKCSNSFPVHSIFISSKRQPFCLLAFGCQQVNNPPPSLFVSLAFVRQHVWRLLLAECHSSLFSILFCRSPILHDDISSAAPSLSAILVGFKFPAATCSNPAPTKGSHNANERESQTNKKDNYTTWWTRLAHNKIKKRKERAVAFGETSPFSYKCTAVHSSRRTSLRVVSNA